MENKKLINILLKDMDELEGLISDLKKSEECDPLELEIIHSKAKGIKNLLGILNNRNIEIPEKEEPSVIEKAEEKQDVEAQPVIVEEKEEPIEEPETEIEDQSVEQESEELKEEDIEEEPEIAEEDVSNEEEEKLSEPEEESEEEKTLDKEDEVSPEEEPETEKEEINQEEVELQEPDEVDSAKVLGDKFQKGKSVNDLISEGTSVEQKFSRMPLESIKSAIGINDRFLFTRELFEGNADLFTKSIEKLDSLNNINEAVTFLRENFKWKKNETSLKFIELVKRRFQND